mmetsp:Transcript_37118/g.72906  ORF Transcript_37118/g.72906 Transcript_37118/m.72906 type:complete len:220 (+) Transcript_37118:106-765(+)
MGMRVDPPTSTTCWTSPLAVELPSNTSWTGARIWSNRGLVSVSNCALLSRASQRVSWKQGIILTSAWSWELSLIFSCSAAFLIRLWALGSEMWSVPPRVSVMSWLILSTIKRSTSSPPRCALPAVVTTWKMSLSRTRRATSRVPPPQSNTSTLLTPGTLLSRYARAAATGSATSWIWPNPAWRPASSVARFCASSKLAGMDTVAVRSRHPRVYRNPIHW